MTTSTCTPRACMSPKICTTPPQPQQPQQPVPDCLLKIFQSAANFLASCPQHSNMQSTIHSTVCQPGRDNIQAISDKSELVTPGNPTSLSRILLTCLIKHRWSGTIREPDLQGFEPLFALGQGGDEGGVGDGIPAQAHAVHAGKDLHGTLPLAT